MASISVHAVPADASVDRDILVANRRRRAAIGSVRARSRRERREHRAPSPSSAQRRLTAVGRARAKSS